MLPITGAKGDDDSVRAISSKMDLWDYTGMTLTLFIDSKHSTALTGMIRHQNDDGSKSPHNPVIGRKERMS